LISAIVLAAGAATRFGAPKQRLLLAPVLDRVRASAVDEVVVVIGAYQVTTDARTVKCPDWERGPGASLRCGLDALSDEVEAVVVVLADGPQLSPKAIDRVIDAWRPSGDEILAATYEGERGHPLLVARSAWDGIPDAGLRSLSFTPVPCDDLGHPGDVDTPEDLRAMEF
jgi:CTP:molybdopterin cytidylyltransferase MocA